MKCIFLGIIIVLFSFPLSGQQNLREKVNKINQWYKEQSELPMNDQNQNRIDELNVKITDMLLQVLNDPKALSYPLERWLNLSFIKSSDNHIRVFSWAERTGGSFQTNINILYVTLQGHYPKGMRMEDYSATEGEFRYYQGTIDKIYELQEEGHTEYLLMGGGISCNTCVFDYTLLLSLTEYWVQPEFCLVHDYRVGDGKAFYDADSRILTFDYTVDLDDSLYGTNCSDGEKLNENTCRFFTRYIWLGNTFIPFLGN
ncbi:MAG: hypothetical protein K1X54_07560 [Flavobacteriales bacterium]|nr:hypothetical protein [Flavobacteriales bacterium]